LNGNVLMQAGLRNRYELVRKITVTNNLKTVIMDGKKAEVKGERIHLMFEKISPLPTDWIIVSAIHITNTKGNYKTFFLKMMKVKISKILTPFVLYRMHKQHEASRMSQ